VREARHITILVVVAAIVLGIVAVGAYAALADDTTPPVTTSDAAASYWGAATIHLTATDAEGVAYIYSKMTTASRACSRSAPPRLRPPS